MMPEDVITKLAILSAGAAVAWAVWRAAQPKPVFTVRLIDGAPEAVRSVVTPAFMARIREVASAHEIARGQISGYAHGKFIRLLFSDEITEPSRQQLRNWWATFGWAAPQPGPRECYR
ncbi:MAG TPA: DUF3634 family protein [Lacipirellula sp.]